MLNDRDPGTRSKNLGGLETKDEDVLSDGNGHDRYSTTVVILV